MAYRPEEQWTELRKGADFQAIAQRFGISPVLARIIRNRDIVGEAAIDAYLNGTLRDMEDPLGLDGLAQMAQQLHTLIEAGKHIRVIGDYDIDGVCATTILLEALERAGARVDYAIPDRVQDGFGLNIRLVEQAAADGADCILTCDNGIAAIEQTVRAKELGLTVLITDHHEPVFHLSQTGEKVCTLPAADGLADPKLPGCTYPNKDLCGAALAWKLVHVYESLYLSGARSEVGSKLLPLEDCPLTMELLPFAAFATVGDVMQLTGENRILVREGLARLQQPQNPGLRALLTACGLQGRRISCYHIGFVLGPCLNASGRLDTARRSVELFRTREPERASGLAEALTALNEERKALTASGAEAAIAQAESDSYRLDRVLVLYLPGVHESVAGIIASRVKEHCCKPVLVFTDSEEEAVLKGSGRSVEAYHMYDALSRASDLFVKFGGHAMAAGASVRRDRLEELRRRLNEDCTLTGEDLKRKVRIDLQLPLRAVTESFVSELERMEPTGTGNRRALFALRSVKLLRLTLLGQNRNVAKLLVEDAEGTRMQAMLFDDPQSLIDVLAQKGGNAAVENLLLGQPSGLSLTITFQASVNEFRGVRTPQIVIQNYY